MLKKALKIIGGLILGITVLIIIIGTLFINLSPEFGGKHSEEDVTRYKKSGHYKDGIFINEIPTSMDMSFSDGVGVMMKMLKGNPKSQPKDILEIEKIDSTEIVEKIDSARFFWFGHSALLIQMENKNILMDPMLGLVPAPHPLLGKKRFSRELPIEIEKLPIIDAVIISHDHYDHLDYGSIVKLKDKTKAFYVPLGVGAHLKEWGVEPTIIHELNWWEEITNDQLTFAFTPSRHFSGRGLGNRFTTLWGSWVIQGSQNKIYFSGDGGYGPHFKEIGEKYGPFDLAFMECGQYNEKWANIHMMPEQTAQAAIDVKANKMMPIHWGAFTLALHSWKDPVERVNKKAKELNMPVITPKIGEFIFINSSEVVSDWWQSKE